MNNGRQFISQRIGEIKFTAPHLYWFTGILSIGKTRDDLYVENGGVKTRNIATDGLFVDHRIIEAVAAADFLQNLKMKLEKPMFTFFNL
jgi:pyruvate/2-oxoglutarate dehydrogenase complex dihydrolipoamide acyltransferase (E2) component